MDTYCHITGVERKLVNGKGGLRMVNANPESRSPFEIDEPPWEEDSKSHCCIKCMKKFTFTVRRHHCRRCGKICCSDCCNEKLPLLRLGFVDPERVCKDCIPFARSENSFFKNHLHILLNGAVFLIQDKNSVHCYLDPASQRKLLFKNCCKNEDVTERAVMLNDIASTEHVTEIVQGTENLIGIILKIIDGNALRRVKMVVQNEASNNKSYAFLEAIQQALKLLFDGN